MKAFRCLFLILAFSGPDIAAHEFDSLVESFNERRWKGLKPREAMDIFQQMAELDGTRARSFLLNEAKGYGAGSPSFPMYPNLEFKDIGGGQFAGVAQAALAAMGHDKSFMQLYEQSFHVDKVVRYRTLRKIALIDGPVGLALLSNFMGDNATEVAPMTVLEAEAAFVLSKKLDSPPYRFNGDEVPLGFLWLGEPQQAYYKWRYLNYGPVPGREEIFEPFSRLKAGSFPSLEEIGDAFPEPDIDAQDRGKSGRGQ